MVSTNKQKNDLNNQIDQLKQWCFMNGYTINAIYSGIASGISFENRKGFFEMLDEILNYRVGFELFKYLFGRFGTGIVVIPEVGNAKLDSEELFEEIKSMLHCYSIELFVLEVFDNCSPHHFRMGFETILQDHYTMIIFPFLKIGVSRCNLPDCINSLKHGIVLRLFHSLQCKSVLFF